MSNIILAAGTQERWNYREHPNLPKIKQLLEIDGKTLIERIQDQFPDSIVITNDKEISKVSKMAFKPESNIVTVATLFSTYELWKEWTTILLGDVLYGSTTRKLIRTQKQQLMFYGDRGEIYAFKFHQDVIPLIHFAINRLVNDRNWTTKYGKLWNLYRIICGEDYRKEYIGKYFTFVKDCRDFDTQDAYIKYAKNQKVRK